VAPDGGRLGVLGGTFNPPHLAHLAIARDARVQLGLERVVLMPARIPPHKPALPDPGAEHRLRMCELLVRGVAGLSACPLEIERDGPSYTVDTLNAIAAGHPDAELTLILGADTARALPDWREPRRVLAMANVAVAARAGHARRDVLASLAPLIDPAGVRFLDMPLQHVSSSTARERAGVGTSIEDLVGPAVASYVAAHGLYGACSKVAG
jgi:nicotinate-nucleotide adenylyltransferase